MGGGDHTGCGGVGGGGQLQVMCRDTQQCAFECTKAQLDLICGF